MYRGQDLEAVVLDHLSQMLNTRQGSSLTCPDYGIVELSELLQDFPDALGVMQRALKNTITKYEPRMKNVQVRAVQVGTSGDLNAYFEITAQLQYPDGTRRPVRFNTSIDESSNVKIA